MDIKVNNCFMLVVLLFLLFNISQSMNMKQLVRDSTNLLTRPKNYNSILYLHSNSNDSAMINFKLKNSEFLYSVGLINKKFAIESKGGIQNLAINNKGDLEIQGNSIIINTLHIKGEVLFNNIPQWILISHDVFTDAKKDTDWSCGNKYTQINDYNILGGHCITSNEEIYKITSNLPKHSSLRIEALYHFTGNWNSETGYMKIASSEGGDGGKYLWTQRCKNIEAEKNLNIADHPVCKISVPINITIPHRDNSTKIIFGSTLKDCACNQSYGISDVRIYIR